MVKLIYTYWRKVVLARSESSGSGLMYLLLSLGKCHDISRQSGEIDTIGAPGGTPIKISTSYGVTKKHCPMVPIRRAIPTTESAADIAGIAVGRIINRTD